MRAKRDTERLRFQMWLAMPEKERARKGIPTQRDFAREYNINPATLSKWKNETGFMDEVEKIRRRHLDEELSDVYDALIKKAKAGDTNAIQFAFKLSGRFQEKQHIVNENIMGDDPSDLSDEDLAYYMSELLAQSDAIQDAGVSQETLYNELRTILTGESVQSSEGVSEEDPAEAMETEPFALDGREVGVGSEDDQMESVS